MTKAHSPKPPTKLETITLKVFIHCEGCRRKVRRIIRVLDGVEDVTVDSASGKVTVTGTADVKTILQRLQKYGKHAELWPSSNPAPPPAGKAGANQPKPNNNNNGSDSSNKKKPNAGGEGGNKAAATDAESSQSKKGDGKKEATPSAAAKGEEVPVNESKQEKSKEANPEEAASANTPTQNGGGGGGGGVGGGGGGGGGKKGGKKGGNGNNTTNNGNSNNNSGAGNGNALEVPSLGAPAHDIPIMSAPNTSVVVAANKSLAPYDSIQTGYSDHSAEYATHMFSDENANNCSIM